MAGNGRPHYSFKITTSGLKVTMSEKPLEQTSACAVATDDPYLTEDQDSSCPVLQVTVPTVHCYDLQNSDMWKERMSSAYHEVLHRADSLGHWSLALSVMGIRRKLLSTREAVQLLAHSLVAFRHKYRDSRDHVLDEIIVHVCRENFDDFQDDISRTRFVLVRHPKEDRFPKPPMDSPCPFQPTLAILQVEARLPIPTLNNINFPPDPTYKSHQNPDPDAPGVPICLPRPGCVHVAFADLERELKCLGLWQPEPPMRRRVSSPDTSGLQRILHRVGKKIRRSDPTDSTPTTATTTATATTSASVPVQCSDAADSDSTDSDSTDSDSTATTTTRAATTTTTKAATTTTRAASTSTGKVKKAEMHIQTVTSFSNRLSCLGNLVRHLGVLESDSESIKNINNNPDCGKENQNITGQDSMEEEDEDDDKNICPVCLDRVVCPTQLTKCGHVFCRWCLEENFKVRASCPLCNRKYGVRQGNMPNGMMTVTLDDTQSLPGHKKRGTLVINYDFKGDFQKWNHPRPGEWFEATSRRAYLPASKEGYKVCRLLWLAFQNRLTFRVRRSQNTGANDVISWDEISHKSMTHGGPEAYGYPDLDYLQDVQVDLADKGLMQDELKAHEFPF